MKSKKSTQAGFSPMLIIGMVGILILLVGGGIYAKQKISPTKAVVEEPQEAAQTTSTIALPPLVNIQQKAVPPAINNILAQNVEKELATGDASKEEINAAVKTFFEYKTDAEKIVDWKTYKIVWLKYGTKDWLNTQNKAGDAQWQYMYNNGGKEYLDKAPEINLIKIVKEITKKTTDGRILVQIQMTEKNTTRQGIVVMSNEGAGWKVVGGDIWK